MSKAGWNEFDNFCNNSGYAIMFGYVESWLMILSLKLNCAIRDMCLTELESIKLLNVRRVLRLE